VTLDELLLEIEMRMSMFSEDDSLPLAARAQIVICEIVEDYYGIEIAVTSTKALLEDTYLRYKEQIAKA
jgi:hypothetical protein